MTTIEERINEISIEIGCNCADFYSHEIDFNVIEDGLIQIATEQKEIDIEKAKKSFNAACGWLSVYPWYQGVFEEFVKALEE